MTAKYTTCTIDGCSAPHRSLGYCSGHYQRVRRTGDPYPVSDPRHGTGHTPPPPATPPSLEDTFRANIIVEGDCWVWARPTPRNGYPWISAGDRRVAVHRYSWELAHGPIPPGAVVANPTGCGCVNPEHLVLTTTPGEHQRLSWAHRRDQERTR